MSDLSFWLDSYNDIYSDFDSNHYMKRRISEDFLFELRTEMKYRREYPVNMILLLPQQLRDESAEKIIAASLIDFFIRQFGFYYHSCHKKRNTGVFMLVAGIVIMLLDSWMVYNFEKSFLIVGLKVLLEPAGWFLVWTALDFLFYDFAMLKKEKTFFKELSEIHIYFKSA